MGSNTIRDFLRHSISNKWRNAFFYIRHFEVARKTSRCWLLGTTLLYYSRIDQFDQVNELTVNLNQSSTSYRVSA